LLAHLLKAAVRSLAVTVVLGSILTYATGGLDSPYARGMIGIISICFLLFWATFFFMFGPRVPKHDGRREDSQLENASHLAFRGRRRETDDNESDGASYDSGGDSGDSGGGDGGGSSD
jgi:hypothetical protein